MRTRLWPVLYLRDAFVALEKPDTDGNAAGVQKRMMNGATRAGCMKARAGLHSQPSAPWPDSMSCPMERQLEQSYVSGSTSIQRLNAGDVKKMILVVLDERALHLRR